MNQIIKDKIYGKGTKEQVRLMATIGGMNDIESAILMDFHEGKPDDVIMDFHGLTRKSFKRIEEAISAKLGIAIFQCILAYKQLYGDK